MVWQFSLSSEHELAFRDAYSPDGAWAELFSRADGYLGTELVQGESPGCYTTIDRWTGRQAYDRFMGEFAAEYARLDKSFAEITESETLVVRGEISRGPSSD